MSIIKEIYDVTKDAAKLKGEIKAIRKALRTEFKLNGKFLKDMENPKSIDTGRMKKTIKMLEIKELADAIKYDIPYRLICNKRVSPEMAEYYKIKRISDFDFEKLTESQYLKIFYLKKDYDNPKINLKARLLNIYKQNLILLKLME